MARILVSDLITEIQTELSQVTGTVTNLYGTPRILQHIQDAYLALIADFGDRVLSEYHDVTLDGTTGVIDADMTTTLDNHEINRFEDIIHVWLEGRNDPLPIVPPRMNVRNITSGGARFIDANDTANRPFKVYPITSDDNLVVLARAYPELPLTEDSYIYIDRLLVTYYAAYLYAQDDAASPGQVDKFERLYNDRLRQLTNESNNQPIQLDPRSYNDTSTWHER